MKKTKKSPEEVKKEPAVEPAPASGPKVRLFIISHPLAQEIANFLGKRPYDEVAHLVDGLKALPEIPAK